MRALQAALIPLIVAAGFVQSAAQAPASGTERVLRWRQDLDYFADQFPSHHLDFNELYQQPAFSDEVAAIKADVPRLTDAEITLRLMRSIA